MVHKRLYATELGAQTLRQPASGKGRYATRMLTAGDAMTVDGPRARLLTKMGWADETKPRKAKAVAPAPPPSPPPPPPPAAADELPALREAYEAKFGKKPFNGWKADVLREKIAAA